MKFESKTITTENNIVERILRDFLCDSALRRYPIIYVWPARSFYASRHYRAKSASPHDWSKHE